MIGILNHRLIFINCLMNFFKNVLLYVSRQKGSVFWYMLRDYQKKNKNSRNIFKLFSFLCCGLLLLLNCRFPFYFKVFLRDSPHVVLCHFFVLFVCCCCCCYSGCASHSTIKVTPKYSQFSGGFWFLGKKKTSCLPVFFFSFDIFLLVSSAPLATRWIFRETKSRRKTRTNG